MPSFKKIRYEFKLVADLPPGYPQVDIVFPSFEEADQYRTGLAEDAQKMTNRQPRSWREAFEALGNAEIITRTITETEWETVEEK